MHCDVVGSSVPAPPLLDIGYLYTCPTGHLVRLHFSLLFRLDASSHAYLPCPWINLQVRIPSAGPVALLYSWCCRTHLEHHVCLYLNPTRRSHALSPPCHRPITWPLPSERRRPPLRVNNRDGLLQSNPPPSKDQTGRQTTDGSSSAAAISPVDTRSLDSRIPQGQEGSPSPTLRVHSERSAASSAHGKRFSSSGRYGHRHRPCIFIRISTIINTSESDNIHIKAHPPASTHSSSERHFPTGGPPPERTCVRRDPLIRAHV